MVIPGGEGPTEGINGIMSTASLLSGDPWKLSSPLKQMSTLRECSRGGKRIYSFDPRSVVPKGHMHQHRSKLILDHLALDQANYYLISINKILHDIEGAKLR